jgi:hypothetical protein
MTTCHNVHQAVGVYPPPPHTHTDLCKASCLGEFLWCVDINLLVGTVEVTQHHHWLATTAAQALGWGKGGGQQHTCAGCEENPQIALHYYTNRLAAPAAQHTDQTH